MDGHSPATSASKLFSIRATLASKPGITGQVTVMVDRVPDAISIPAQALFQKSGHNVAYVWSNAQFEERVLDVGRRSGDKILVAKGLKDGRAR